MVSHNIEQVFGIIANDGDPFPVIRQAMVDTFTVPKISSELEHLEPCFFYNVLSLTQTQTTMTKAGKISASSES